MNKCFIRVDGNSIIGTGHQMRCMALAREFKRFMDVVFVSADEENSSILKENGYDVRVLGSQWNCMDEELPQLCVLVEKENPCFVFVDSYQVTKTYLQELKKIVPVVYMDDLHEFVYPCDVLVNYSVYSKKINYIEEYKDTDTRLLLGCKYAPLREEFSRMPNKEILTDIRNVLVLTGGTDEYRFALNFVKKIAIDNEYESVDFHVVCGRYNKDIVELQELEKQNLNIHVYKNIQGLSNHMLEADIAISAGGTTLYELCACGTPTIAYVLADNQIENVKTFAENDYIISVGDIRKGFPKDNIKRALKKASEVDYRIMMEKKMRMLVDGQGTGYLTKEIIRSVCEENSDIRNRLSDKE